MKGNKWWLKKWFCLDLFVFFFIRPSLIQMKILFLQAKEMYKARFCMHFLLSCFIYGKFYMILQWSL